DLALVVDLVGPDHPPRRDVVGVVEERVDHVDPGVRLLPRSSTHLLGDRGRLHLFPLVGGQSDPGAARRRTGALGRARRGRVGGRSGGGRSGRSGGGRVGSGGVTGGGVSGGGGGRVGSSRGGGRGRGGVGRGRRRHTRRRSLRRGGGGRQRSVAGVR